MKTNETQLREIEMKRSRFWLLGTLGVAAVLACALLVAGCGQDATNPVGPGSNDDGNDGKGLGGLQYALDTYGDPFSLDTASFGPGALAKGYRIAVDGDTVVMGTDGGKLELTMQGATSTLTIPKNALSATTVISALALRVATPVGDVFLYDFSPDGLVFNLPATLEVDAGNLLNGMWFHLFWLNPATDRWELQQAVRVKDHKITFKVYHFSKYGIT